MPAPNSNIAIEAAQKKGAKFQTELITGMCCLEGAEITRCPRSCRPIHKRRVLLNNHFLSGNTQNIPPQRLEPKLLAIFAGNEKRVNEYQTWKRLTYFLFDLPLLFENLRIVTSIIISIIIISIALSF